MQPHCRLGVYTIMMNKVSVFNFPNPVPRLDLKLGIKAEMQ